MSVTLSQVLSALEHFAPLPLQEGWDNAGLQVGLTDGADVSGALLCLDVTEAIVDEAMRRGCNLIVSHHPLLFRGLKQLSLADPVQRAVIKAVRSGIAVVSMHTNMDNAPGGVNWMMARQLGLQQCRFFGPEKSCVVPDGKPSQQRRVTGAAGVVGRLNEPMPATDFVRHVKQVFGVDRAQCNELLCRPIQTVALCGGAGDFLLPEAVQQQADAFVTGEMHYHQYFGYEQRLQICVIGHYQSEQYTAQLFAEILAQACPELPTHIAQTDTNPIVFV
ncbi:MAG: Nif3-like dinuclear metal center hexameric protein [Prevotella sp.]|nr:Nif3-like dinuclear metal center hexameric protein [Prevotella sp.]